MLYWYRKEIEGKKERKERKDEKNRLKI